VVVTSLAGCSTRFYDEELFMEEAVAAIRQAISNDEAGEAGAKPIPEAGLLSREATAAVGSAFNTLGVRP
jgi:hypothetical protein